MRNLIQPAVWAAAVLLAPAAFGQLIVKPIFTNDPNDPLGRSAVPGVPGGLFNVGTSTEFDRPFSSPNGDLWIFVAIVDGTTERDVIILGSGTDNSTATRGPLEGEASPITNDPNNLYVFFRTQVDINNQGDYVFSADTNAATARDEIVVRYLNSGPGIFELMAQEGSAIPGFTGTGTYGSTLNGVNILENDEVWFRNASLTGNTAKSLLNRLVNPATGSVLVETDVTVPPGQLVLPTQSVDALTTDRLRTDADATNWLYHADLNGPTGTDVYLALNGTVIAQEGVALPGSSVATPVFLLSGDAGSQQIAPSGGWYAFRGDYNDGAAGADRTDFVVLGRAGGSQSVVAQTDAPIIPNAAETYSDAPFSTTFFVNTVNCLGDIVVGGTTSNADPLLDAVLVLNGSRVLLRQGDQIDYNGDGILNDSAFIHTFNNDDSFLTEDGLYYFNADIKFDATADTATNQAFMVIRAFCPGDIDRDGDVDDADLGLQLASFNSDSGGDTDCDGDTDDSDLGRLLANFGSDCSQP